MKHLLLAVALVALVAPAAMAQLDADSHIVTVTLNDLNFVDVDDSQVDLVISIDPLTGTGSDTQPSSLDWGTTEDTARITVETDLAVINFPLTVEASNVAGNGGAVGTAALVPIALSTTPTDLITGISHAVGTCDLTYVATADISDVPATETHTVMYTLVSP